MALVLTMHNQENISAGVISDNEIIDRVIHGEKNLYALIVRRYNQRLYRIGMSMINDESEVEDVMQVAYIKAYENLDKFAFRSAFSTWLIKILINESLLRLKARKRAVSVQDAVIENVLHEQHANEVQTPFMKMLNSELKAILEEAIRQLPEKYRTVFIMREIENMNVSETKECLDISEVNVKVRLNRAKAMLKNSLNALYKKEDILHFHLKKCDRIVQNVMGRVMLSDH